MRSGTSGIALLGLLATMSHGGAAEACGQSPAPFYVVESQAPMGADTPLNAPLQVKLREEPTGPADNGFAPKLTLTIQGGDQAFATTPIGYDAEQAWVPVEPLQPGTTYEAHFNPGYEGIPDTIWTFTTGTESAPALSLEGELEVTIEHGTQVIWQCPTSACICGCSDADLAAACTTEEVAVTNARVKLPRALGGFARRSGTVSLTDNQPYDQFPPSKTGPQPYTGENVSSQHFVDLDDPELVDVLIPLPEEETPYRPCFAFSANDARGDEAQVASLCLDDRFPADPIKEAPLTDGLANDQKKPSNTSSGCSASGPRPGPGSWLVALGLLAGLRGRRHLSRRERARASISGPVSLPSRVPSRLLSK